MECQTGREPSDCFTSSYINGTGRWILVLDEGKIVDQGVHTDFIQRPGYYQQMWELQNENGYEPKKLTIFILNSILKFSFAHPKKCYESALG
ncbi:MAG: hypothetical protein CM1200mP28_12990 [Deltaproteobacteria bacterium]|nr:MAG: hypothetical protein CM1200mP28_12990 [Deltaproteobacteria bacterium]